MSEDPQPRIVKLTEILSDEQIDMVERILKTDCGNYAKSNALKRYLETFKDELEAKGVVPGYLAYVITFKQWTGGTNGDRSFVINN